jgi:predicted signal transduction protein with EAL and GGDEF domain
MSARIYSIAGQRLVRARPVDIAHERRPGALCTLGRIHPENILRNLAPPIPLFGEMRPVSTSIGITLFSGTADTVESVLMKADSAMYQAKSAGRNTLRFFDPVMQASITAQQQLERDLDQALAESAFVLHYQPQLNEDRCTVGAEALIRWQRADGLPTSSG